jgi:TRAP-type C4-dicarboxylate transport system permease small subunit
VIPARRALAVVSDAANRLTEFALVPLTVVFVFIVFGSVLTRFVFHHPIVESVELGRLAFVWVMLLAAAVGVHRRAHVAIVALRDRLPAAWARATEVAVHLACALFGAMMCYYGIELAVRVWETSFPTLGWSQAWLYVPLAVSGGLIAVHALHLAVDTLGAGSRT